MLGTEDGQHGGKAWRSLSDKASAWSTADGMAAVSADKMRCPALWPSGMDLMAACTIFSAQPKAWASRQLRTLAWVADAANAKATG